MRNAADFNQAPASSDARCDGRAHFRRIRVLFIVNNFATWPAAKPLYKSFRRHPFCDVTVVSVENLKSNQTEDQTYRSLIASGIPAVRFNGDHDSNLAALRALKPNLIIRQSPWGPDFPEEFSTAALSFSRLGYVPYYAIESIAGYDDSAVDFHHNQPYHRQCSVIFAESETAAERFRASQAYIEDRLIFEVGNLKIHSLRESGKKKTKRRKVIVYAPHHSIGSEWLRFGTFAGNSRQVLDWLNGHPEYEVWFRPHPTLKTELVREYGVLGKALLDSWKKEFLSTPNRVLAETWEYGDILRNADLILTDGISILFESQIFAKPVIFLERSDHLAFTAEAENLLEGTYRFEPKEFEDALQLATHLLSSKRNHYKRALQRRNMNQRGRGKFGFSVFRLVRKLQTTWY